MLKLSFILPCYNVEPYIGRCLDSLLAQDLPYDEYEIICVNDCSPDNLRDVVMDYQKRYPNIRLIEHEVNKTAGGARNTGMEAARGEYLWFVDPDDTVAPNVLANLYASSKKQEVDMLIFNFSYLDEKGELAYRNQFETLCDTMNGIDFVMKFCPKKRLSGITSIWREIYRRDFCLENKLRYPEIKSSQDVVFLWKCLLKAERVTSIDDVCYNHCRRQESTTGSKGKLKAVSTLSASLFFPNILLDMIDSNDFRKQILVDDVKKLVGYCVNDCSRNVLAMSSVEKNRFYSCLIDNAFVIDRMIPYMNRKTKKIMDYKKPKTIWLFSIRFLGLEKRVKTLLKI